MCVGFWEEGFCFAEKNGGGGRKDKINHKFTELVLMFNQ
jgi:hypothetical protein